MKKKKFKIGEIFQCGLVKLKCVIHEEDTFPCNGCYFDECDISCADVNVGSCCSLKRTDGKNVIFVKVDEP